MLTVATNRWITVCFLLCCAATVSAQEPEAASPSQQLLSRFPEDWRPVVAQLDWSPESEQYYARLSDADLQPAILRTLAYTPEAADFVLDHLDKLTSPKGEADVVASMAYAEHWSENPRVIAVLDRLTTPDHDAQVALAAYRTLHLLNTHRERLLVEQQLATATGDARTKLLGEDESLMDAEKGATVPSYLRRVPPVFEVASGKAEIRVIGLGDFGTGGKDQIAVAAAMVTYNREHPADFGITLGDNFTPVGMASPDPAKEERWQSRWEALYGPMKIKFYPSFGNHDWASPDSPAAELSYHSSTWALPSSYYTYTAGPAQFFAIDTGLTGAMSLAQLEWLKSELETSVARWKVVYGHHPPYLAAGTGENALMVRQLMPILKGRADVYLAGHYHSLEDLRPVDGVHFFISAGGGRPLYPIDDRLHNVVWAVDAYGFTVLDIDNSTLTIRFLGTDGSLLHESTVRKEAGKASETVKSGHDRVSLMPGWELSCAAPLSPDQNPRAKDQKDEPNPCIAPRP